MPRTFDREAAITRSLLGWGVVAGPFYVAVGLALALTRPGFRLAEHALSLLMLGEWGWLQRANLVLSGLMVLAAAYGIVRAVRDGRGLAMGVLSGVYGVSLWGAAAFPPDPMGGFPPGAAQGIATTSGILHLVFGAIGFLALAAAAFAYAGWSRATGAGRPVVGVLLGGLVLIGFFGGAVLSSSVAGVALLWLAVLAGWAWLALASVDLYRFTPHPDPSRRSSS